MREIFLSKRSIWLASLLLALLGLEGWLIHKAMMDHQKQLLLRLERTVAGLLNRAHEQKDDLAMEAAIQSFAKGPAVLSAAVIDSEGKILAHNLPAELGKPLRFASMKGQIHSYPLRDGTQEWGRVLFALSSRSADETQRRLLLFMFTGAAAVWGLLAWHLASLARSLGQARTTEINLSELVAAQQQKLDQATRREQQMTKQWSLRLQEAVSRLPEAIVLLDGQQRVIALNDAACKQLGISSQANAVWRSWQELPVLQFCGKEIERSIAAPDGLVESSSADKEINLKIRTNSTTGTWISISCLQVLPNS